jgi:hypothetical protein
MADSDGLHRLRMHDRRLFFLNLPVNTAVASWTPTTLPSNWMTYRLRWEAGHAIAALLAIISLTTLIWTYAKEMRPDDKALPRLNASSAEPKSEL